MSSGIRFFFGSDSAFEFSDFSDFFGLVGGFGGGGDRNRFGGLRFLEDCLLGIGSSSLLDSIQLFSSILKSSSNDVSLFIASDFSCRFRG